MIIGEPFLNDIEIETALDTQLQDTELDTGWLTAVRAAQSKQATNIKLLDLTAVTTFCDYFLICTGGNTRQMQTITDEIALQMKKRGEPANSIEGYEQGEWILTDYSDIIVHVFNEKSREFYDLDRLWKNAAPVEIPAE